MSSQIKSLYIKNIRKCDEILLHLNPKLNFFVGNNAQGKTTILEAVYFCCLTKSHRTDTDNQLVQFDKDYGQISILTTNEDKSDKLDLIISKQGKRAKFNQKEFKKISDYIGMLNVVMFSPEDFDLLKGSPGKRRRFIDIEIGQASRIYLKKLIEYKKILKIRNEYLKKQSKQIDYLYLDVITEQLAELATNIIEYREQFINGLEEIVQPIYNYISNGETLKISYRPSITVDGVLNSFQKKYDNDIQLKTTTIGPHRDDVEFYIDDKNVKDYSSQGQQRSVVISVKLALLEFIKEQKEQYPILLLDDVFSELDAKRRDKILEYATSKTQTLITTTNINDIEKVKEKNSSLFIVNEGKIKVGVTHERNEQL